MRRLRFDRHEVIAVRVIDPAEEDFPFASATLFRGLELPQELLTDPRGLRQHDQTHRLRSAHPERPRGLRLAAINGQKTRTHDLSHIRSFVQAESQDGRGEQADVGVDRHMEKNDVGQRQADSWVLPREQSDGAPEQ